jgi:hypothetical protein
MWATCALRRDVITPIVVLEQRCHPRIGLKGRDTKAQGKATEQREVRRRPGYKRP